MKLLLIAFLASLSLSSSAQIKSAKLQASGLTCSMCSNSINKALQTLPFVDKVIANIKESTFSIKFKEGTKVDIDAIKEKVDGAGFSVSNLSLVMDLDKVKLSDDSHVTVSGNTFHVLKTSAKIGNSNQVVNLSDKNFVSSKVFKKNKSLTKMECYETGMSGTCCSKDGIAAGTRIYHITI